MSERLHSRVFAVAAVRGVRTLLRKPYRGTRRFSTIPAEFSTRPSNPRSGECAWTSARAASHGEQGERPCFQGL
jgi:hypothetical protein